MVFGLVRSTLKQVAQTVHVDDLFVGVHLLPVTPARAERVCQELARCLREDCRMSLTRISRRTHIPVSTLHDNLKRLRERYHLRLLLEPRRGGESDD